MDLVVSIAARVGPVLLLGLIALPSLLAVLRQRGLIIGTLATGVVSTLIIGLEALSIKSGLPYGRFLYDEVLGYRLFGTTPWIIVLAYIPLILMAFWLASSITTSHARISLTVCFTLFISAVLEPVLAALSIRQWQEPGPFFGAALLVFVGWLLTSTLGAGLLHILWSEEYPVKRSVAFSGLFVLLFITGANFGTDLWIPLGLGVVLSVLVLVMMFLEKWKQNREINH